MLSYVQQKDLNFTLLLWALPFIIFVLVSLTSLGSRFDLFLFGYIDLPDRISPMIARYGLALTMLFVSTLGPFIEELINRLIPFGLLVLGAKVFGAGKPSGLLIGLAIVASSIVFSYCHGGVQAVPIQGVMGIVLATVFVAWSAGLMNLRRGLAASAVVHGTYNLVTMLIVIFDLPF